jgi:hypothetical protein
MPFTNEMLNTIASHHDVYLFLNGYFNYHYIFITLKDRYKTTFMNPNDI